MPVSKVNGTYVCTMEAGKIVPGAQRECPFCAHVEPRDRKVAWMQHVRYASCELWECVFLGGDAQGNTVAGGCSFAFPVEMSLERVKALLLERCDFLVAPTKGGGA